jgi:GH24 family phage-related lysozyme (muramidase)
MAHLMSVVAGLLVHQQAGKKVRTTIWRNAQSADWRGVCERVTDFVNSGGRRLQGLVNRREEFRVVLVRSCAEGAK